MNQNLLKGVMCKAILSRAGVQLFNVNKKVAHSSQPCQHYTGETVTSFTDPRHLKPLATMKQGISQFLVVHV